MRFGGAPEKSCRETLTSVQSSRSFRLEAGPDCSVRDASAFAVDAFELPTDTSESIIGSASTARDVAALAGHTMAVIQGMPALARDGAKRDKLKRVMETAMLAWPTDL